MTSLYWLQDFKENGSGSSDSEQPLLVFPQLLVSQPPAARKRRQHTVVAILPAVPPPVPPLQGFGLVHVQSLALMNDCLRLYSGLGSQLHEQHGDGRLQQPLQRLDQLLKVLVAFEARVSAMRMLLLASNPAVGRADYYNATQGELWQSLTASPVASAKPTFKNRHVCKPQALRSISRAAQRCALRRTCYAFMRLARLMSR